MRRVGLIGCGTIGTQLALAIQKEFRNVAKLVTIADSNAAAAAELKRRAHLSASVVSIPELIKKSDIVLEAASSAIVTDVVGRAIAANKDILVMSAGGLLLNDAWRRKIKKSKSRLFIPSGALAGLDAIKAMASARLSHVTLISRKPPKALASAPYIKQRGFGLDQLTHPMVVFEGSPREVVKHFPQNTNVAAALSLASGLADDRIKVRVIADPTINHNRHEVEAEGDCGKLHTIVESRPSQNPKTSEIAVRSGIAALYRIFGQVQIGT